MITATIEKARAAGARLREACEVVGIDVRTVQRWRHKGEDGRQGPRRAPANRLSEVERQEVVKIATSPEFRNLSPKQIVPQLADRGTYVASESTFYRVLKENKLDAHRGPTSKRSSRAATEHVATAPGQVWSWDITYMRSPTRGEFFYLYIVLDVWSRKIVAAQVFDSEDGQYASDLIRQAAAVEDIEPEQLVLHQDNGAPMKGATLKATLEALGVMPSYSRPRVSDDNPYSESLFRTAKYRPWYPQGPFEDINAANQWVADFVHWYNHTHLHSAIGFVSPNDRHEGADIPKLEARHRLYQKARARQPERWSGKTRSWTAPRSVLLNPSKETRQAYSTSAQAA